MMKRTTICALALVAAFSICADALGDTLFLRDGEQVTGSLLKMTKKKVRFDTGEGVEEFKKEAILKVQLQRKRMHDGIVSADAITDPALKAALAAQPSEQDFPAAGYVTLFERQSYDLTEPGIVRDTTRRIVKVLQQRGEDVASQSVWYFEDTDVPEVDYALTVTPDGRVLHLSDAALKNESLYARVPDYRRLSRLRFACKEPRPGSVLDFQFTVVRKRDSVFEPFYTEEFFRADQPVLRKKVEVVVPSPREAELLAHLDKGEAVAFTRSENGGVVRFVWTLSEPQRGIIKEPLMPPKATFVPRLVLGSAGNWDALAVEYAEALAELDGVPEDLAAKARELVEAGGAEAVRNFVARCIRTARVPQNHFRFVPRAPQSTAERGLANELDKNFLYYAMLRSAGIDAKFALLRGRSRGALALEVPSVRAFDHSAVLLPDDGLFSSAASDVLPFESLPGGLHGAPAFVILEANALMTEAQAVKPKEELSTTHFEGVLDAEGILDLTLKYAGTGNEGKWIRQMKDLDDEQIRNQAQQWAGFVHPSAVLTGCEITDLNDLTVAPSLTMTCTIPNFATAAGEDLMLFTLPGLFYEARNVGRPERMHGLFWDNVSKSASNGTIRIPDGFSVYSVPGTVAFDSGTVSYRANVNAGNGAVSFRDAFALKVDDAPREAYSDYKQCLELRARVPIQRIILTRR